jgi:putative oxidoreductase
MSLPPTDTRYAPYLLAGLRIVAGLLFLAHGIVKLLGFPPDAAPGQQELLSLFGLAAVIEVVTGMLIYMAAAGPGAFSLDGLLRKPVSETTPYSQA